MRESEQGFFAYVCIFPNVSEIWTKSWMTIDSNVGVRYRHTGLIGAETERTISFRNMKSVFGIAFMESPAAPSRYRKNGIRIIMQTSAKDGHRRTRHYGICTETMAQRHEVLNALRDYLYIQQEDMSLQATNETTWYSGNNTVAYPVGTVSLNATHATMEKSIGASTRGASRARSPYRSPNRTLGTARSPEASLRHRTLSPDKTIGFLTTWKEQLASLGWVDTFGCGWIHMMINSGSIQWKRVYVRLHSGFLLFGESEATLTTMIPVEQLLDIRVDALVGLSAPYRFRHYGFILSSSSGDLFCVAESRELLTRIVQSLSQQIVLHRHSDYVTAPPLPDVTVEVPISSTYTPRKAIPA